MKPKGQMHMKPLARSRHVPSCRHGDDRHSLMSISHKGPETDAEKEKCKSLSLEKITCLPIIYQKLVQYADGDKS